MGISIKKLEIKCSKCGEFKTRVTMKNPFIDDYLDECPKCDECGDALQRLNAMARSEAKRENEEI